jgi:hypothetical protein
VLGVIWAASLVSYFAHFEKERWDLAAAYVVANAQPDDLVLINSPWMQLPFAYYARREETPLNLQGVPANPFDRELTDPRMTAADLPALRSLVGSAPHLWLVYSHQWYTDPEGLIPVELANRYARVDEYTLRDITIYRYSDLVR